MQNRILDITGQPFTFYQCEMGKDGVLTFTYFGPRSEQLWGVPSTTLLKDSSAGLHLFHPDDVKNLMAAIRVSFTQFTDFSWTARMTTPQGKRKILKGISQPEQKKNGKVIWNGVLFDKSEISIEKSEILRELFTQLPTVFVQFELNERGSIRIPYMSQNAHKNLGIDHSIVMATGSKFLEMIHVEDRTEFLETVKVSAKNRTPWNWKGRILTGNNVREVQGYSEAEVMPNRTIVWGGILVELDKQGTIKRAA